MARPVPVHADAIGLQRFDVVHVFSQAQDGGLDGIDRRAAADRDHDIGPGLADCRCALDDGADRRMLAAAGEDAGDAARQLRGNAVDQACPGGDGGGGHDQRTLCPDCRHFPRDRPGRRRAPADALLGQKLKQAFRYGHGVLPELLDNVCLSTPG